ncbi:cyclic pyranopterin monophosphate synthase MoaC [Dissulfurirhabdus thermomarina]|uniref:Cyclic pyranopterin monophosphate synthase n=1 Tax=Dissulfurirhabdus thermomarina TaxID=1765737 RepID=A0A6N9TLK8_DISTH|nr:cyclic pyranopterin monophosphate synthase MoaC [Dissulfurirhabdus thermomarina]NDY42162.1 cyclic pyranopterin monophosphate synthase MoaC [Dissulfurirhabdus thermomarina]NMX22408.1 cyclic pyranopterin monophosphate synthase MoaC [Dissulfurirhabdus thermomarina]
MTAFTHIDAQGQARMVDVSGKPATVREAVARGRVRLGERAFELLVRGEIPKGDVLAVARVAGIMAAKRVDQLIPLCHPLPVEAVEVHFEALAGEHAVEVEARVRTRAATGVEMEALTAVSVAALAIYDMCKSVDKGMTIETVHLVRKSGGKSGDWER